MTATPRISIDQLTDLLRVVDLDKLRDADGEIDRTRVADFIAAAAATGAPAGTQVSSGRGAEAGAAMYDRLHPHAQGGVGQVIAERRAARETKQ